MVSHKSFDSRGVSETVGVIFMLGLVVLGTGALAVSGGDMITELSATANQQETVNEMSKIASEQARIGYGGSASVSEVSLPSDVSYMTTTVTVTAVYKNGSTSELYKQKIVGLEREVEGVTYYMQSGGVFTQPGGVNSTTVESKPSFSYNGETLVFPILTIDKSSSTLSSGSGASLRQMSSETGTSEVNLARTDKIRVSAKGTNYVGLGEAFASEISGNAMYNHSENRSTVVLGNFKTGVSNVTTAISSSGNVTIKGRGTIRGDVKYAGGYTTAGAGSTTGNVTEGSSNYQSLDGYIEREVEDARKNATELEPNGTKHVDSGYYYVDGDFNPQSVSSINFDASDGNITVVVEEDVTINPGKYSMMVSNTSDDRRVRFIVGGEKYFLNGGSATVDSEVEPNHHVVLGKSDLKVKIAKGQELTGLLIAPRAPAESTSGSPTKVRACHNNWESQYSVCIGGGGTVNGAIIAGDVVLTGNSEINYQDSVQEYSIDTGTNGVERPGIFYLHVSTAEVAFGAEEDSKENQ